MVAYARKRKHKWIWGVVFVAAVVGLVVLGAVRPWESGEVEGEGSAEVVVDSSEEKVDDIKEAEGADEEVQETAQYEGENPNEAEELSGAVTFAGVLDGVLRVRVNIDQYLSSGSCRLELTRGSEVRYTETVGIVDSAATATCEGFDVPMSGLAGTEYGIRILVESGGKSGTITGEVSL